MSATSSPCSGSPIGLVYSFPVLAPPVAEPHPHVIIGDAFGGKQYWVVAGYTEGKPAVSKAVEAAYSTYNLEERQVCVHMDNAAEIVPCGSWERHRCTWMTYWFYRYDAAQLVGKSPLGRMKPEGLKAIAQSILSMGEDYPSRLPEALKTQLQVLAAGRPA